MNRLKQLGYFFLPLPLAAGAFAQEDKAIRIGFKECQSATNFPPAIKEKISSLKWYFAHASVGMDMMGGIADLHASDANNFQFQAVSTDKSPPAKTQPCSIYEHNRGNPGWKAKFDQFETCIRNGWHAPSANIVMNKLCFIDQAASFKYYIHSMTNLEAEFPQTVFVYMTMPLTTASDGDNYLRHAYNERVRDWCQKNGRVLFDVADIEAHDPDGKLCTFSWRNKTAQKLCEKYTNDGGHLIGAGRQLVARGFYALAVSLVEKNRLDPSLSAAR